MHGAPKIILTKSLTKRLLWILLFFCSWAMFLIQTEQIFENYLTYPKKTNVEIVSNDSLFPDVTFCFRRGVSFYDAQEWLLAKKERLQNNETSKNNIEADMKLVDSLYYDIYSVYPIFHSVEFQSMTHRSAISKEEAFIYLVAEFSNGTKVEYKDLDIKEIPGAHCLKCFAVSFAKYNNRFVRFEGHLLTGGGMIPDMSTEKDYLWKDLVHAEGAIVFIHQSGVRIDPIKDSKYHILQPNQLNQFFINVKQSVRVGPPHGKCSTSDPFGRSRPDRLDVPYRQQDCKNSCVAKKILDRVGKVSMQHPPLDGMQCWLDENDELATEELHVKRWCNYTDLETDDGQSEKVTTTEAGLWLDESVNDTGCPCFPPCHGIDYDVFLNTWSNPFNDISDMWFNFLFKVYISSITSIYPIDYLCLPRTTVHLPLPNM